MPAHAIDVRAAQPQEPFAEPDESHDDDDHERDGFDLELVKELVEKTANAALERVAELSDDLGGYLDNARWQLPRLNKPRNLQDDSLNSNRERRTG